MSAVAISGLIDQLFSAERQVRDAQSKLADQPEDLVVDQLSKRAAGVLGKGGDAEAIILSCIAEALSQFEGSPKIVDTLIAILGSDEPEARFSAGEVLEELVYSRFKDVALGVERALERLPNGNPALTELPYLLAEVPEPGVVKLLGKFLRHSDAEAVAAAIAAAAAAGDPALLPEIEKLLTDGRSVQLDDEEEESTGQVTLGELASEAKELLSAALSQAD
jgi:hypothetical protein